MVRFKVQFQRSLGEETRIKNVYISFEHTKLIWASLEVLYHSLVLDICYGYRSVVIRRDSILRSQTNVIVDKENQQLRQYTIRKSKLWFYFITLNVHHLERI